METKTSNAKDFFINLGAIVALYIGVISLLSLLFTAINVAYPKVTNGYTYFGGSASISWPVATLIIFFPIFLLLMWLLEKEYKTNLEKRNSSIHRWLTYITLFLAGLTVAIDLITVLYYFIDGQELTAGFLMKVAVLLVVASSIFIYFISDLRNKLTEKSRVYWRIFAGLVVISSIVWGFSVLGSPHTQRLYKYDEQKVSDLQSIDYGVTGYYGGSGTLPESIEEISALGNYHLPTFDSQNKKPYEYQKTSEKTYNLCAEFNKDTNSSNVNPILMMNEYGAGSWNHPAGRYCFKKTINPNMYDVKSLR